MLSNKMLIARSKNNWKWLLGANVCWIGGSPPAELCSNRCSLDQIAGADSREHAALTVFTSRLNISSRTQFIAMQIRTQNVD